MGYWWQDFKGLGVAKQVTTAGKFTKATAQGALADFIGFDDTKSLYDHYQWRTVKDQDGAFRDMPYDPQVVNIQGSIVVKLPPVFKNGKRLGHNWSLKWVLDQYFRK